MLSNNKVDKVNILLPHLHTLNNLDTHLLRTPSNRDMRLLPHRIRPSQLQGELVIKL